jgi:mRNA interferase YafQ
MKKYQLDYSGQFLKDLKLAKRRGLNLGELSDVTDLLQEGHSLPAKYRDHNLTGGGTKAIANAISIQTGY